MLQTDRLCSPAPVLISVSLSSCGNRRSCEVPVTERVFGEYPCQEQTRYLEVSYSCAKPSPPPPPPPAPIKPECMYTHARTHTHTHTHTTFVTSLFRNTLTVVVFPPEILLSVDESLNAFSWSEIRFLSPGGATFSFVAPQNKIKLQLSVISNQRLKLFCSCYHALILLIYFV